MSKTIDNNRRFLARLVYSKQSFTVEEILREYKANRGNAIIDGFESIRGYLRGLEEYGALRSEGGRYVVVE